MKTAQPRYNWTDPDAYEAFMGRWSEHLAGPFLTRVDVTPGGRVLDVACVTGVLSKALAEAGASVIGVDASEGYLEGARRRRPHPNIAYEGGDMRHMLGFEHPAAKIFMLQGADAPVYAPYMEYHPPDINAGFRWLYNPPAPSVEGPSTSRRRRDDRAQAGRDDAGGAGR